MSSVRETIAFGLGLIALLAIVAHCSGCGPSQAQPRLPGYCYDEDAFRRELLRCVDNADTREASRTCRKEVHAICGIAMTTSSRSVAP